MDQVKLTRIRSDFFPLWGEVEDLSLTRKDQI